MAGAAKLCHQSRSSDPKEARPALANILFVHQNFPGQFPFIADALRARGDKVAAIGSHTAKNIPGIDVRRWTNSRSTTANILSEAMRAESDLIRGRSAAMAALQLQRDGFRPDLIIGHPGWGETLHMREIFPAARQILLGEFYYTSNRGDLNFDPEFNQPSIESAMQTTGKNATQALAYTMADRIIVPTPFQASFFPDVFKPLIHVHHEGVDLKRAKRRPNVRMKLPNGKILDRNTPIITFVSRNLERLRGFHIFMRALPRFLDAVPEAQVVVIGTEEGIGYGGEIPDGFTSWKQWLLAELGSRLDLSRVHFLGRVSHEEMIAALSIGRAHVYYTYPFVLSWSLIEAMACECLILGSDTEPLHDAVHNGINGLLNPFFDVDRLSDAMTAAALDPDRFDDLRIKAGQTAAMAFDRERIGVPGWIKLIDELL